MTTIRDVMHPGVECIGENDTLQTAAGRMRDLHVGAMPICGTDDRLHGIITDRDIVVRCIAEGGDPTTATAGRRSRLPGAEGPSSTGLPPEAAGAPLLDGGNDACNRKGSTMKAKVGDRLILEGTHVDGPRRVGVIIDIQRADGTPPYLVHWLADDHESLVLPGPDARIESGPVRAHVG